MYLLVLIEGTSSNTDMVPVSSNTNQQSPSIKSKLINDTDCVQSVKSPATVLESGIDYNWQIALLTLLSLCFKPFASLMTDHDAFQWLEKYLDLKKLYLKTSI